jgi:hypothetical protein
MKKGLLYLVIFSYATIMLKPVLPFMTDIVAHTFWYSQHMATVHFENGQYHVHTESIEAAKKDVPANNNMATVTPSPNEHVFAVVTYDFSVPPVIQHRFLHLSTSVTTTVLTGDFPPPKA